MITSYDIVTRDIDTLGEIRWDRLLLDEAQDVKNPATKRARALRQISARRRVAMTGTPIENHLGELWALMDILNPGLLGSREWFGRTFARPIQLANDEPALERLRAVVRPFILRRAKDSPEVELDLPPITVEKDYCRLTVEQASLYQATVDNWLPRIESHEDRFGRRGAVLAMLGHLKQVCNHPEMLLHTGQPLEGRSGKLERLVGLLEEMPADDKALVFTQYPSFDRLVPYLAERTGRSVGFFHGRLNARQRDELLTAFATPEGPSILVISIRAGGRGLNLPSANHVFHFDRWWNPAVEQQATDRAHRLGQRKAVFVHSLICTGTLEERIDALLDSKRELVEKVMAGTSEDWLGDLDLGAIRAAVALAPDALETSRVRGPWSRSVLAEVAGDIRPTSEVDSLEIKPGTVVGHVGECTVTLAHRARAAAHLGGDGLVRGRPRRARGGGAGARAVVAPAASDGGGLGGAARAAGADDPARVHVRRGRRVRARGRGRARVRGCDRGGAGAAPALARLSRRRGRGAVGGHVGRRRATGAGRGACVPGRARC